MIYWPVTAISLVWLRSVFVGYLRQHSGGEIYFPCGVVVYLPVVPSGCGCGWGYWLIVDLVTASWGTLLGWCEARRVAPRCGICWVEFGEECCCFLSAVGHVWYVVGFFFFLWLKYAIWPFLPASSSSGICRCWALKLSKQKVFTYKSREAFQQAHMSTYSLIHLTVFERKKIMTKTGTALTSPSTRGYQRWRRLWGDDPSCNTCSPRVAQYNALKLSLEIVLFLI